MIVAMLGQIANETEPIIGKVLIMHNNQVRFPAFVNLLSTTRKIAEATENTQVSQPRLKLDSNCSIIDMFNNTPTTVLSPNGIAPR